MEQNNKIDISNAIITGLSTLSDPDIKVPSRDIEALATFKGILGAIINGELILATPDRILPEGVKAPSPDEKVKEDK